MSSKERIEIDFRSRVVTKILRFGAVWSIWWFVPAELVILQNGHKSRNVQIVVQKMLPSLHELEEVVLTYLTIFIRRFLLLYSLPLLPMVPEHELWSSQIQSPLLEKNHHKHKLRHNFHSQSPKPSKGQGVLKEKYLFIKGQNIQEYDCKKFLQPGK